MTTLSQDRFKYMRLSSRDKLVGNNGSKNSDFKINIANKNQTPFSGQVTGIKVQSVVFPNVFYNIRSVNNTFSFTEGATRYDLQVGEGFYTAQELAAALKAVIDAAYSGTVTITLTPYSKKFNFKFSGGGNVVIHADDTAPTVVATMASRIGFSVDSSPARKDITAEFVPRLEGLQEMFIVSSTLGATQLADAVENKQRNVIAVVPNKAEFGGVNVWENVDDLDIVQYNKLKNITQIDIRLENSRGELLDLQNHDIKIIMKAYW